MITPIISGFISRTEAGLALPKSISKSITPERGGVGLHYGGPPANIRDHADCVETWRDWQAFHMGSERRWADIAYTGAACDHGYALAGRGAFRRTAGNGTDYGNQNFYAVVWLGGEGETPTALAQGAFAWWVHELRTNGNAGERVVPHNTFKNTECPGGHVRWLAAQLDRKDLTPQPEPVREDDMRYTLIRVNDGTKIYAVRPGVCTHVPSPAHFWDLVNMGLTVAGPKVEVVDQARFDRLSAFLPTA